MPPVDKHVMTSREKTGKDFREVHEWIDMDPEHKAERHDITRMHEFASQIEERFGKEAADEYIRHLSDDIKAKFNHLRLDLEKSMNETLAYFGVK